MLSVVVLYGAETKLTPNHYPVVNNKTTVWVRMEVSPVEDLDDALLNANEMEGETLLNSMEIGEPSDD